MAEKTEFLQAIDDAILDADSLEKFINGSEEETVLTRLSTEYPTLQNAIKTMFENGGLPAKPFATKALMEASSLDVGSFAVVINDKNNEGFYQKNDLGWEMLPLSFFNGITKHDIYTNALLLMLNATKVDIVAVEDWVTGISGDKKYARLSEVTGNNSNRKNGFAVLKPNTEYVILKTDSTDMFRAAVFKDTKENISYRTESNELYIPKNGRVITYDDADSAMVYLKTSYDETLLWVTTAHLKKSDNPITVLEVDSPSFGKRQPKNLYNPKWVVRDVGIVGSTPSFEHEKTSVGSNKLVTYYMPVKANTTYTISKGVSSRFYIAEVTPVFIDGFYTRKLTGVFSDNTANNHSFTTSSDVQYLVVYVSNNGEQPSLQLELGETATSFVDYVTEPKLRNIFTRRESVEAGSYARYISPVSGVMSAELQDAINAASGGLIYLTAGIYEIDATINIPSDTHVVAIGNVVIRMINQTGLETVDWRGLNVKTYLKTAPTSKGVVIEGVTVEGTPKGDKSLHWGICMQGAGHSLRNVSVKNINWIDSESEEPRAGGNGWGLVFYYATDCSVYGGRFEGSGYENIGTDNARNIYFHGVFCGKGWRTSFQVHRNSFNIVLADSTIIQTSSSLRQTHAAVTMHGVKDAPVRDVKILNCTIDAQISPNQTKPCGAIQAVNGGEHNITISNCDITTNNYGISAISDTLFDTPTNWVITNNRIKSKNNPVKYIGLGGVIANNIFITDKEIIYGSNNQQTVTVANNNIVTPS